MRDRRIGKFSLPAEWVKRRDPMVTRIMGMCAILRAEHKLYTDDVEYVATCWKFRELEEGCVIPTYKWTIGDICEPVPAE